MEGNREPKTDLTEAGGASHRGELSADFQRTASAPTCPVVTRCYIWARRVANLTGPERCRIVLPPVGQYAPVAPGEQVESVNSSVESESVGIRCLVNPQVRKLSDIDCASVRS